MDRGEKHGFTFLFLWFFEIPFGRWSYFPKNHTYGFTFLRFFENPFGQGLSKSKYKIRNTNRYISVMLDIQSVCVIKSKIMGSIL